MISFRKDIVALHILSKGKKFIGQTRMFYFIIGITITHYVHITRQVQAFELLYFSVVGGQWIVFVKTRHFTLFIKVKLVGKNIFFLHTKFSNNRINKSMEPVGDDVNVFSILFKESPISLERFRYFIS